MSEERSAAEVRAELLEAHGQAEARVAQLAREQREAGAAREAARRALIQAEREGVDSARRTKLERELQQAEARVLERWPERLAGARQAVGDAQSRLRAFTAEHLNELVENLEAQGASAAEALNEALEDVVEARRRWVAISIEITRTVSSAGVAVEPGAVTPSRADEVERAVSRLLAKGGESGPHLRGGTRERARAKAASAA